MTKKKKIKNIYKKNKNKNYPHHTEAFVQAKNTFAEKAPNSPLERDGEKLGCQVIYALLSPENRASEDSG